MSHAVGLVGLATLTVQFTPREKVQGADKPESKCQSKLAES